MSPLHRIIRAIAPWAGVLGVLFGAAAFAAPAAARPTPHPPVFFARTVIGYSVQHRPIVAYHLGDPRLRTVDLLVGQIHGDEHAGVRLARSIVTGAAAVDGINLWVVPTMNPDGNVADTRQNAHGVDLNRNWPSHWIPIRTPCYTGPDPLARAGGCNSGRGPLDQPETRVMYRFLDRIRPSYVVVMHQPLDGVDTTDGGTLDPRFDRRLAADLGLPLRPFRCWSFCHGSLTGWYTTHHRGVAITVEFPAGIGTVALTGRERIGTVAAFGGRFGPLAAHAPRVGALRLGADGGTVRLAAWAWDPDSAPASIAFSVRENGRTVAGGLAALPSPALDAAAGIGGAHGLERQFPATPGPHDYCLTAWNVAAGYPVTRCASITVGGG